jgi:uncharacterized protein
LPFVALRADTFALEQLALRSGQGRRLELHVSLSGFKRGTQRYDAIPDPVGVILDVSRTTGAGYALRLRFSAEVQGPCMRCLEAAEPRFDIDAREVSQPGGGDELQSPYVDEAADLDLAAWVRDALLLAVPEQILCRADCAGLCPVCGVDLNEAAPGHHHEKPPDPRWAALRDLELG